MSLFLGLDQGSSASKAVLLNEAAEVVWQCEQPVSSQQISTTEFEQDPEELLQSILNLSAAARSAAAKLGAGILAAGLSLQRSGVCAWDASGKIVQPLITWRDSRTAPRLAHLEPQRDRIESQTGIPLLANYSGSKIALLQERFGKEIYIGTLDTYFIYRLTNGKKFVTEAAMAARSLLCTLGESAWNPELCQLFNVDPVRLAEIKPSVFNYADLDGLPLNVLVGDAQAGLLGALKGVGSGILTLGSIGSLAVATGTKLEQRSGYTSCLLCSTKTEAIYFIEAVSRSCGAVAEALITKYKRASSPLEFEQQARLSQRGENGPLLYLAINGSGAPDWRSDLPAISSIPLKDWSSEEFIAAALESVAGFIINNLIYFRSAGLLQSPNIQVFGGLSRSNYLLQYISDCSGFILERSSEVQGSARGAALLVKLWAKNLPLHSLAGNTGNIPLEQFTPQVSAAPARFKRWLELKAQVHAGKLDGLFEIS